MALHKNLKLWGIGLWKKCTYPSSFLKAPLNTNGSYLSIESVVA